MKPTFILLTDNQLVNMHHIIGATYSPPLPGPATAGEVDEDGEIVRARAAKLVVALTQTELEITTNYDGALGAFGATSTIVKLHGADADRVWELLLATNPLYSARFKELPFVRE